MRDLDATWTGVYPAVTTQFTSDQALDLEAARGRAPLRSISVVQPCP
jgi:hypothetical protein